MTSKSIIRNKETTMKKALGTRFVSILTNLYLNYFKYLIRYVITIFL